MAPAGSTAVRDAIKKYQPLSGFHGHIHESKGVASIGRTKCFNPGSEYGEGVLRGLLVDLTEKGIKSYLFTSG
jgi:Icc-related predicted phosphoesterase